MVTLHDYAYTSRAMPNLHGKELSELYPRAKSYDELEAQRRQLALIRQPRFSAIKISAWTTLSVVTLIVGFVLINRIMGFISGESAGPVLAAVSFTMLVALLCIAIIYYLHSLTEDVATKLTAHPALLHLVLGGIITASGAAIYMLTSRDITLFIAAAIVLPACFLLSILAARTILRH